MRRRDFGKRLVEIRKSKGLTQEELSGKCNITVRTIRRIESGSVVPRSYTIRLISEALGENLLEIVPNGKERRRNSRLNWFNSLIRQVRELFNLKTNTMKKVSVLSIISITIGSGLFILIPNGHSQKSVNINYSKYTQVHSRGIIYFFPKGEDVYTSNVKDTADYRIRGDLIQEYKNKIFLNREQIGMAFNSDTVVYKRGRVLVVSSYWRFSSSNGKNIHYLIPSGVAIDNHSMQIDTENIYIGEDHIREYDYKIFYNGKFVRQTTPGDTIVYKKGEISFVR